MSDLDLNPIIQIMVIYFLYHTYDFKAKGGYLAESLKKWKHRKRAIKDVGCSNKDSSRAKNTAYFSHLKKR